MTKTWINISDTNSVAKHTLEVLFHSSIKINIIFHYFLYSITASCLEGQNNGIEYMKVKNIALTTVSLSFGLSIVNLFLRKLLICSTTKAK